MSANTYGRQVVLPLVNKSGGGVIAGDVVVLDTTNNDSFTTNTAGAFTGVLGVAQATIASNATGPVLLSGYAALVNVNASVTRGNYGKTYTVAKQATDAGASRVVGAFCQFLTGGTTPDAHVFGVPDLGTGSGNYTSSIVWTSGTSMPGGPATNQRITRTDLGQDAFYDGTRWLSTTLYHLVIPPATGVGDTLSASNGAGWRAGIWNAVYDIWMVDFYAMTFVSTTNTSGAFWTQTLYKESKAAAYAQTSIVSYSTGTGPDTASEFIVHTVSINALLGTSSGTFAVGAVKTSTPGNITGEFSVTYRLVLT